LLGLPHALAHGDFAYVDLHYHRIINNLCVQLKSLFSLEFQMQFSHVWGIVPRLEFSATFGKNWDFEQSKDVWGKLNFFGINWERL